MSTSSDGLQLQLRQVHRLARSGKLRGRDHLDVVVVDEVVDGQAFLAAIAAVAIAIAVAAAAAVASAALVATAATAALAVTGLIA